MEKQAKPKVYNEYDNFAFHPYNVMLTLLLFAVSALFLALMGSYIYTRVQGGFNPVKVPWLFALNTLVLLASSATMLRAKQAYLADHTARYQQSLLLTLGLTLVFLGLQMVAWAQLFDRNIFPASDNGAGYLYVLSWLHFAHVVAGLPFLAIFYLRSKKTMVDPVTVLVYFSDPDKRLRLRLLNIYWHFLDALWVLLVLFLFLNQVLNLE